VALGDFGDPVGAVGVFLGGHLYASAETATTQLPMFTVGCLDCLCVVRAHQQEMRLAELRSLDPPRSLVAKDAGKSDLHWLEIGDRWPETIRSWCGLGPGQRVLYVGCGIGRMAVALAPHLGEDGLYEGSTFRNALSSGASVR
jgi:hypothetical protein